jgi:hypothetical protein
MDAARALDLGVLTRLTQKRAQSQPSMAFAEHLIRLYKTTTKPAIVKRLVAGVKALFESAVAGGSSLTLTDDDFTLEYTTEVVIAGIGCIVVKCSRLEASEAFQCEVQEQLMALGLVLTAGNYVCIMAAMHLFSALCKESAIAEFVLPGFTYRPDVDTAKSVHEMLLNADGKYLTDPALGQMILDHSADKQLVATHRRWMRRMPWICACLRV